MVVVREVPPHPALWQHLRDSRLLKLTTVCLDIDVLHIIEWVQGSHYARITNLSTGRYLLYGKGAPGNFPDERLRAGVRPDALMLRSGKEYFLASRGVQSDLLSIALESAGSPDFMCISVQREGIHTVKTDGCGALLRTIRRKQYSFLESGKKNVADLP